MGGGRGIRRATLLPRLAALGLAASLGACGGKTLAPYPEAVVTVDTDMPVPRMVSMLRLDLYDDSGWYETRERATPDAADWPLSFSLVSRDENRPRRVLLRLRAYPAGRVRDYRGERYEPIPTRDISWVPTTLEQICSKDAPQFTPPGTFTLRRGKLPLTNPLPQGDCPDQIPAVTGARIHIAKAGKYRFRVTDTYPSMRNLGIALSNPLLFLRQDCSSQQSQLACNDNSGPFHAGELPSLDVQLAVGDYTLFVGSSPGDPLADLVVRIALASQWNAQPAASGNGKPQLSSQDAEPTPKSEPEPGTAIDRLILVDLDPAKVEHISVVLRGACAGNMARIGSTDAAVDLDNATTCVDAYGQSVKVTEAPSRDKPLAAAERGSFGRGDDCSHQPKTDAICVPAGPLLLGDPRLAGEPPPRDTTPERVAGISRFWIDRGEVTVGQYRAALNAGLTHPDDKNLVDNPNPLLTGLKTGSTASSCTWSDDTSFDRGNYPMNCISWSAARSYCRFVGGDLPSEAQWEYAASAAPEASSLDPADRPAEMQYPWELDSHQAPDCKRAVYGRLDDDVSKLPPDMFIELGSSISGTCVADGYGPAPVSEETEDKTPLGIVGMGGGVSEWMRDAAYAYTSDCWRGAKLDDPGCFMDEAPLRAVRGGSWAQGSYELAAASRGAKAPQPSILEYAAYIGFRCVYDKPPTTTQGAP